MNLIIKLANKLIVITVVIINIIMTIKEPETWLLTDLEK